MITKLEPTERETKLLEYLRGLEFGRLIVDVQHGEPVLIRHPLKTVKL